MQLPVAARVSSAWGWRTVGHSRNFHSGIDFSAPFGAPVFAAAPGRVVDVYAPGKLNRYGLTVVLQHAAGLYSLSAHLSSAFVRKGEWVNQGQQIAAVGNSGGTREDPGATIAHSHLHFELLTRWPPTGIDQDRIDPMPYFTASAPSIASSRAVTSSVTRSGVSIGFVALAFALWYANKKKRRPGWKPAGARSTDATGGRWLN